MSSGRKWMVAVVVGLVCILALYYGVLSGGDPDPSDGILASDPTIVDDSASNKTDEPVRLAMGDTGASKGSTGILSDSVNSVAGNNPPLDLSDRNSSATLGPYEIIGSESSHETVPVVHDPNDSLIRDLPNSTTRPVVRPDPGKGDVTVPAINDPTKPTNTPPQTKPEVKPEVKPNVPVSITPTVAPKTETYTVKSGDTMSSIAATWFGDGNKWDLIAKANPLVDPKKLQIGQKLNLPAKSTQPEKPKAGTREYTVRPGDTLITIARAVYGDDASWKKIYDANKKAIGNDPDHVTVGMKLTIPSRS